MTRLSELGRAGIDEYVDIVREVWPETHARRNTFDYALHLFDHASKLGEAIRRDELHTIFSEVAELTNWLFGFVAKLNDVKSGWEGRFNVDTALSDMIWYKYPGICSACFDRAYAVYKDVKEIERQFRGKCLCLVDYPKVEHRNERLDPEERREAKAARRRYVKETAGDKLHRLSEIDKMLHTIYAANIEVWSIEHAGFHLLEEVGEVSRALVDLYTVREGELGVLGEKRRDLCDEIAEVFAWICSLVAKLRKLFKPYDEYYKTLTPSELSVHLNLAETIGLEWALWHKYVNRTTHVYTCPYCGQSPCARTGACSVRFAWEGT